MDQVRVTLDQVLGDDSDFWRSIRANPGYPQFEQDLEHIITESRRHGMPYVDIKEQPNDMAVQDL
jgi:hypothetical protein